MDEKLVQEVLDELFSSLEALETRTAAILEFLKDKRLATDEELAPHFEHAGSASNVRWRAARVRINHLLSSAAKADEKVAKKETAKAAEKSPDPIPDTPTETDPTKDDKRVQDPQKPAEPKPEEAAGKDKNKQEKDSRPSEDTGKDKA